MNNINYAFFEEFKKLDKLCSEIYGAPNGVTHYIDDMKSVSYSNYHRIPNWEYDMKQLKRLRHIRNNLAHMEGSFNENICTTNDIKWIEAFRNRILTQSDPLAMQYQNSKTYIQTTVSGSKNDTQNTVSSLTNNTICDTENSERNNFQSTTIIMFVMIGIFTIIVTLVLVVLIALMI